jgi:hypothetical protein
MKKYMIISIIVFCLMQRVYASHVREETASPDLSYSVMLRTSAGNTEDTSGNLMIASFGVIAANEKMQQNERAKILSGLVEMIENMIDLGVKPETFFSKLKTSFQVSKVPAGAVSRLLIDSLMLADKQNKVKVTEVLMQCPQCKFHVNAGIEDAIVKRDRAKAVQFLRIAHIPEAEVKRMMKAHPDTWGIHESVSFSEPVSKEGKQ